MKHMLRMLVLAGVTLANAGIAQEGPRAGATQGEPTRAVRVEASVDAPVAEVWRLWTTSQGAEEFFAQQANIQLAIGGPYEIQFDPKDETSGTKGLKILSYAPGEMISFQWNAPTQYPEVRNGGTWVVVQFHPEGPARTRVTITHLGWKHGEQWDEAYDHFVQGWSELMKRLERRCTEGPIDWNKERMMYQDEQEKRRLRRSGSAADRNQGGAMNEGRGQRRDTRGYAPVNGLKMYYEIEGSGDPLVFIPPAFGFAGLKSFPTLVQNHSVITVDLQGNGRTADIPERPISIEQYAKDVVGLLKYLGIAKADFFGESYGANTVAVIALRYPEIVGRVVTYAATFGPPQDALNPETTHFEHPPTADSSYIQFQRESYRKVAPDPNYWPRIYDKVGNIQWVGFSKEELASIKAPMLIVLGDHDFVRVEHAVETVRLIPRAELAVIPDASHFAPLSEPERVIPIVTHFLEKPDMRLPLATARNGYHPGETR
jgi:pimeloyl-ACP methyl ester carboxylesterase/uncharacterized protein YndB with AHSA1/START domain